MIDFEKELNAEQLDVVKHGDGPCLILAGAGSGKTRVATYRVAYLLERGVNPENILLVTFTNKAADEMKERVKKLTGSQTLPWAGTFHSIGNRILRLHASALGYQNNFSILDSDDSESLIKLCAKDYKSAKKFPSSGVLQAIISFARNAEMPVEKVLEARYEQWLIFSEVIKNIANDYARIKKEANAMDFDDLLANFSLLLNDPRILSKYSDQFKYILVDEYQDTNKIQASIIKKLSSRHKNILVVGDDAQSIYSFRAADIENILSFEKDYPRAKIFKLETNYRSSKEILDVANDVIANNAKQYKKKLKTFASGGAKPALLAHGDGSGEAQYIVKKIHSLLDSGIPKKEIAVLFRAAHHSQMLEMELVKAGIPYDYRGGLRFFERAHVKDTLAYLRVFNNLADTAAWMRVLMHEDGIGPAGASKIIEQVKQFKQLEQLEQIGEALGDKAKQGWYNFTRVWEGMMDARCHSPEKGNPDNRRTLDSRLRGNDSENSGNGRWSPAALIEAILQSPFRDYLESEYLDSRERIDDIKQLRVFASKHDNLEEFLAEAGLQESFRMKSKDKENSDRIVLSTIHQSKGLEWSAVFLINLINGAFPNERATREDGGIEEERRLFYVAITRAKKHLFLSYPMNNERGGGFAGRSSAGWGEAVVEPSIFLGEIGPDLIDDRSLLMNPNLLVLNPNDEPQYVDEEDKPISIKSGSFLRSVDDL